jgi:LytS/YehU family sensor histidine kinase
MQNGLNEETAGKVAQIIFSETKAAAVAVTNLDKVLAFVGMGNDHHNAGTPIVTTATKIMMESRSTVLFNNRQEIGCPVLSCPLSAVIDAPLIVSNELVGSIKLFKANKEVISPQEAELIQGIADFLSLQLAQRKLDEQQILLVQIECQMLKAQINPHFFFNTLGTIQALIDASPRKASGLIKDLADFYRRTLRKSKESVALQEELESVRNYVRIEKVRFGDKINVVESIPGELMQQPIPVFSLQLLVENAIRHGLGLKKGQGTIQIIVWHDEKLLYVKVADDGVGMSPEQVAGILIDAPEQQPGGNGIGLMNIHRRIQRFYGEGYGLKVESVLGQGTQVTIRLPIHCNKGQQT